MSFLGRLFGGGRSYDADVSDLEARLMRFEEEARRARPGYQGTPLNKAGDLLLRERDEARAVEYYGRAIDAFLEDQQREAARGVANKIVRVRPQAVRTLCTLTWLDLAARHNATALLHLRDYVEAARKIDEHDRAADQIYQMARVYPQMEFVGAVADALDSLGFDDRATTVRGWAADGGSPDTVRDDAGLEERCVKSALASSKRLPESR